MTTPLTSTDQTIPNPFNFASLDNVRRSTGTEATRSVPQGTFISDAKISNALSPHVSGDRPSNNDDDPSMLSLSALNEESKTALISQIREFLAGRAGFKCKTNEIVAHFKVKINGEDVVLFRKLLKGIATFEKQAGGIGSGEWILKDEFQ